MRSPCIIQPRGITLSLLLALSFGIAQIALADETDIDDAKEKSIADRFQVVLEKNPRRGTALDKVYGFHVERATLDAFVKSSRDKANSLQGAEAGSAWMIVGLVESLRGHDAAAVSAFEQAEKLLGDNYLASYYLSQSLILVGQPDKAAEALERSIQRKPAPADLLEIYQALGRLYQRAQKSDKALDVWNRLESQFPNDLRVQEQIATALIEENQFAAALPRYQALAKNTRDKYRQAQFQMEVAEIKVRLGKADEAIKEFEALLGQLLPENWLYREVRRRIEAIYLRTDDQAGLIAYYETWLKKSPKDLEVIARLSRLLASFGRNADSRMWLEAGLKLAPTKKELRHALINQLVSDHKYHDAAAQYELLDKFEPNNPDTLREWGRLILKDGSMDEAARRKSAAAVWQRLIDARPKDSLVVSQVAELFRQADLADEALQLYHKAIELAPDQSQYREYLGEYYHVLKRKDEALATWREIADGDLRTAPNVARMAEVLRNFGYITEAIDASRDACQLDPKDFALQLKHADLLAQAERHSEALDQLEVIKKLAANDEESEAWLSRKLRELYAADKLKQWIEQLNGQGEAKDADHWLWLARAYETDRRLKEAAKAVAKATELAPQSVPVLKTAARIYETQHNLMAAVEINTRLAATDRRFRTEYLKQIAVLEQKLGRKARAIQAGRDLIAAAPGNPELYEFFSQLCFQLGATDEGLAALRRSVRVNPTETRGMLLLAAALAEQFRTSEAIELYWQAFEKSPSLEARLDVVGKLADLYLQTNQFDRLVERLERQRREPNQQREMTICLAQAHQSVGDDGNARQELEKLLTDETQDVQLWSQLVKLCESDGDLEAAIKYQQQVYKLVPGRDQKMRLFQLLTKAGENDEAIALLGKPTVDDKDPASVLKALDTLLTQGNFQQAAADAEALTREQPKNWELLFREGQALANLRDRYAESKTRFEAILALTNDDDEPSILGTAATMGPAALMSIRQIAMPGTQQIFTAASFNASLHPLYRRGQLANQVRTLVGLTIPPQAAAAARTARPPTLANQALMAPTRQRPTATDYGMARMFSLAWLYEFAKSEGKEEEFLESYRQAARKSDSDRAVLDWYYLAKATLNPKEAYAALKEYSKRPDVEPGVKLLYIASLGGREMPRETATTFVNGAPVQGGPNGRPLEPAPLGLDEMDHVVNCYRAVEAAASIDGLSPPLPQILTAEIRRTQIATGQFTQQVVQRPIDELLHVMTELKRCGRDADADALLKDALETTTSPLQIAKRLEGSFQEADFESRRKLVERLNAVCHELTATSGNSLTRGAYAQTVMNPTFQARIIGQMIDERVNKNRFNDAFSLLEWSLADAVEHPRPKSAGAARLRVASRVPNAQVRTIVSLTKNGAPADQALTFPLENEFYDHSLIQILRQVRDSFEYGKSDVELAQLMQKKLEDPQTPAAQKVYWQLGLSYVYWWEDDKDRSLELLAGVAEGLTENQSIKLELARLYEERGDNKRALETIDSLPATDQQAMQEREQSALRLAVRLKDTDRARTAAERLFGLRLDSNLQIQLAQQMHQLGMFEQEQALLARAGRQAGNKTEVLLSLMDQYKSQGQNDVAAQIAYQLLRRTGNRNTATPQPRAAVLNPAGRAPRVPADIRQQALAVLKGSGKLPEMMKKAEMQLEHAPKSQRLIETLIEYANASGDSKKVEELTARMIEAKKDDPQFRYNLGMQLVNQGKHKEAVPHFQVVAEKNPALLRNNYSQMIRTYRTTNSMRELVPVLESLDLKTYPENYIIIRYFMQVDQPDGSSTESTVTLFKKVWNEVPDQRQFLLQIANNEAIWKIPEMYSYLTDVILPPFNSLRRDNGWQVFGQIQTFSSRNDQVTIVTPVHRLLTIAQSSGKLEELSDKIEKARAQFPEWEAGIALEALVNLRRNRIDVAKTGLQAILPSIDSLASMDTSWAIAQDLKGHSNCEDLRMQYLESACSSKSFNFDGRSYPLNPLKELAGIYKQRGRAEEARQLILARATFRTSSMRSVTSDAYMRVQNGQGMANLLTNLGYPLDAIRIYQEQLGRAEDFEAIAQMYGQASFAGSQGESMKREFEASLENTLQVLKPEMAPELLAGPSFRQTADQPASAINASNVPGEPLNLLITYGPKNLEKIRLSSIVGKLVDNARGNAETLTRTRAALEELQTRQPNDLSVRALTAQVLSSENEVEQLASEVDRILALIETMPLDPPSQRGTFTAKQRHTAMSQVPLWFVARECLKHESLRAKGNQLAERVLQAADRQTDNGYACAILSEWRQLAHDAGDEATAGKCADELLKRWNKLDQQEAPRRRGSNAVGF